MGLAKPRFRKQLEEWLVALHDKQKANSDEEEDYYPGSDYR